ncbi:Fur family transcriptional regulator [Heliophilum fasciatum]|uniref:Fur family peroxide stress response transcriptional regulator n=1 Tax=Heliophilum fasciatum TaxID=35700 RepID=A0A4R2RF39_9FIRM|nr:transcriptional repressor [Heliophilum fasciatum]MCW2279086.1 Fe2+ or Zn2+ uptake regulation protein [Heliophilum fasciatum]TCP61483.1 Fur family peroxide stress response transcriptional regulator [Heliophilum fasciatum]
MAASRMTRQKALVLEIVQGTTVHPTADWVYQEARRSIPDISLGTVYRNLNALAAQGMIREMNYAGDCSRYDGNMADHYHFVCVHCHQVYDLFEVPLLTVDQQVFVTSGHEVYGHRVEFCGKCAQCSASEKQEVASCVEN